MADNKDSIDFSDLTLDRRTSSKAYSPSPARDTGSVEITDGKRDIAGNVGFRIPPAGRDPAASKEVKRVRTSNYSGHGANFNRTVREKTKKQPAETVLAEYEKQGGYIRRVTVKSWPGSYSFYEKFVRDAAISHSKRGAPAPHVPFFSYIPQYSQLSAAAFAYYLHMKEQLRAGIRLPEADFSYVLLYIYEIINLEGMISPLDGAELLAKIWTLYRPMHPSLDKYLSEWMADYCMVYNIPLPATVAKILPEVGAKSGIKEFFADAAVRLGVPLGKMIRLSLSDYSAEKSRYAKEIPNFVSEVEEVFDAVIAEHAGRGEGLFSEGNLRAMSVTRDAFCGSLCASNIKKKITVETRTFFRAPDARRIVTELMKGSENIVRARHGVKARLSAPPVTGHASVITSKSEDEMAYLSFYDSPDEPLTASRAAEIEAQSWQNVAVLTEADEFNDETEEVAGAISTEDVLMSCESEEAPDISAAVKTDDASPEKEDSFASAISGDARLADALRCAVNGGSFTSFCREAGLFADDAASRINEIAMEYIGDVVLERDGMDYTFVEDYRGDVGV